MKIKIIVQILNIIYPIFKKHLDKESVKLLDKLFENLNKPEVENGTS
jgi:hypothetical protein